MKLKFLALIGCLSGVSSVFANTLHAYPQAQSTGSQAVSAAKEVAFPGTCEIEIVNRSYEGVEVSGRYLDGTPLDRFPIPASDREPHDISLYYYDKDYGRKICHDGMDLRIVTYEGYEIYHRYTTKDTLIEIESDLNKQIKTHVQPK